MNNCCGPLLLNLKLFLQSQAAGICSSGGEKATAICRRVGVGVHSLNAAYDEHVLPVNGGSSSGCVCRFSEKRAGGIMTEEINTSAKLSKLAPVIRSDQRSETADLLRFPPLNEK